MGPGLERLRSSRGAERLRQKNLSDQEQAKLDAASDASTEREKSPVGGLQFSTYAVAPQEYNTQLVQEIQRRKGITKQQHSVARRKQERDRLYGEMLGYDGVLYMLERMQFRGVAQIRDLAGKAPGPAADPEPT